MPQGKEQRRGRAGGAKVAGDDVLEDELVLVCLPVVNC